MCCLIQTNIEVVFPAELTRRVFISATSSRSARKGHTPYLANQFQGESCCIDGNYHSINKFGNSIQFPLF